MSARKITRATSSNSVAGTPVVKARASSSSNSLRKLGEEKGQHASHVEYEFGGPLGALGVIVGLPVVICALYYLCNDDQCVKTTNPLGFDWHAMLASLPTSLSAVFTQEALIMYFGWMLLQVVLERILPGELAEGAPLDGVGAPAVLGKRLAYTLSGHLQFWLSLVLMGHSIPSFTQSPEGAYSFEGFGRVPLELIYDHYVPLIVISIVGALILSIYLYLSSFIGTKLLAKGGVTGNIVYDFFIGRELNPRIGTLDLKEFCELRPGLIGWLVINMGMATKQYLKRKAASGVGSISSSMLLVVLFQGIYVWDAVYSEKAILTTMDITTDGFGFMLAFGDLAWVPFIYSLQARYLVDHDPSLPLWQIVAIAVVHFAGFYLFRAANSQKDAFRRDPNAPEVRHLTYLSTKRGTNLITSGYWGLARKINYTGDWLVTLSWCLLCGGESPVPYFQALYFAILLVHRAIRDDEMCKQKYGDDWDEYKRRVPYLFIPNVF